MKKEYKVIIAIILAVWIFAMGMVLGIDKGIEDTLATANSTTLTPTDNSSATTTEPSTTQTPTTTTPPTTTGLSASTVPSSGGNDSNSTTQPTTKKSDDPASLSKAEIVEKMNSYIAQLKAEQNMTAHKVESIKIEVVDCSVPSAISIINGIISGLAGDEEKTYTFTNGTEPDGGTPYSIIPPTNKDFLISEAGVATAEAKKSGTDTVYTVILAVEDTTAAAPIPQYNSTAIGYLDLTSLDLSGVTISKADMHYPGSTVEITVNEQGKVTKLINKMPMTGEGVAELPLGLSGNATFQGGLDEAWDFTY